MSAALAALFFGLLVSPARAAIPPTAPNTASTSNGASANPSRLHRFAETQLKEFVQLREDFSTAMAERLTTDRTARRELRSLDEALRTLNASLQEDENHPTNFSAAEMKADLFAAQEAAQILLELGVERELASAP